MQTAEQIMGNISDGSPETARALNPDGVICSAHHADTAAGIDAGCVRVRYSGTLCLIGRGLP